MNIADKPGVYKNFSGDINWQSTECKVRNADFEIFEKEDENNKEIVFADAVFVSGEVLWSDIKNGLNLVCCFHFCDIEYMINRSGGFIIVLGMMAFLKAVFLNMVSGLMVFG